MQPIRKRGGGGRRCVRTLWQRVQGVVRWRLRAHCDLRRSRCTFHLQHDPADGPEEVPLLLEALVHAQRELLRLSKGRRAQVAAKQRVADAGLVGRERPRLGKRRGRLGDQTRVAEHDVQRAQHVLVHVISTL
eukprot:760875-Pleurochrysis_carterae.AAC.4